MQYPAVHLNFWQSSSLDVIAFLFAILYVSTKLTVLIFNFIIAKTCKTKKQTEKEKKKN